MFSDLNAIFIRAPRRTESADTRAEIRRRDPDEQKSGQGKNDAACDERFDTDDTALISVPALALFLDNFLQSADGGGNSSAAASSPETTPAARAAQAYARTDHPPPPPAQAPVISAGDYRRMQALREDVRLLEQRGINDLQIGTGDDFMASLETSVARALQS